MYEDLGFDQFLSRAPESLADSYDPVQADQLLPDLSGDKISSGSIVSQNKLLSMNLENNVFKVSDGAVDRVELGNLSDGTIGLIIRDINGNILMQISGDKNIIQSPNQFFQIDFNEERLLAKDQGGIPRALFGKGDF